MIWFLSGAVVFVSASLGWLFGGMNMSRRDALEMWAMKHQRDDARAQRDRLNTENAALTAHLAEADAQLQKLVEELHFVQYERDDYAKRLAATDRAWTELAAERDALKVQLSDVVYEVKPNVAIDPVTDPPKEVHYVVKTPRSMSRRKKAVE